MQWWLLNSTAFFWFFDSLAQAVCVSKWISKPGTYCTVALCMLSATWSLPKIEMLSRPWAKHLFRPLERPFRKGPCVIVLMGLLSFSLCVLKYSWVGLVTRESWSRSMIAAWLPSMDLGISCREWVWESTYRTYLTFCKADYITVHWRTEDKREIMQNKKWRLKLRVFHRIHPALDPDLTL